MNTVKVFDLSDVPYVYHDEILEMRVPGGSGLVLLELFEPTDYRYSSLDDYMYGKYDVNHGDKVIFDTKDVL